MFLSFCAAGCVIIGPWPLKGQRGVVRAGSADALIAEIETIVLLQFILQQSQVDTLEEQLEEAIDLLPADEKRWPSF